jgi:2-polyprenyl-3-methyl-5-hydroxy-6-metoxy-1,4-benzoquinol methylase
LSAQLLEGPLKERPAREQAYLNEGAAWFDRLEHDLGLIVRTEQRDLLSCMKDLELFNTTSNELDNDAWYDQPAAFVSMHLDALMLGFSRRRFLRLVAQARRAPERAFICDIGAGCGHLVELLLREHPQWRAEALDKSAAATAYSTRSLRAHGFSDRAHSTTGDLLKLPFEAGQFDVVIAAEVLEHTTDADGAARELVRVLKPGGLLLISLPIDLDIKMHPVVFESEEHILTFFGKQPLKLLERDLVRPDKLDAISDVFPSFQGCLHATFERK